MKLNVNYLKAAALAAGKEEVRYYLKGVAIQASDKGVFIVATDGHRAVAFRQDETYEDPPFSIIIPLEAINAMKTKEETVELIDNGQHVWHVGNVMFTPIDYTYPDWRRIVPKETSGEIAQFNAGYVGDFAKIAKTLGKGTPVHIAHNGYGASLVTFGRDVDGFGLLMPLMRQGQVITNTAPDWAL
jgi:DNA polymerase-3 subunit beta